VKSSFALSCLFLLCLLSSTTLIAASAQNSNAWKPFTYKNVSILMPSNVKKATNKGTEASFDARVGFARYCVDIDSAQGATPAKLRSLIKEGLESKEDFLGDINGKNWGGLKTATGGWTFWNIVDNNGRTLVVLSTTADRGDPSVEQWVKSLSIAAAPLKAAMPSRMVKKK
jgi:hypothetical protein